MPVAFPDNTNYDAMHIAMAMFVFATNLETQSPRDTCC